MIRLTKSLKAWGTTNFADILKTEVEQVKADALPLQQGLALSSYVTDSQHKAVIMNVFEEADFISVRAGIFYSGIIAGCSCADDPTPTSEQTEYCEVQFAINKMTGETSVVLLEAC